MKFIPTRIHGILDYVTGALLILAPWLFGFADRSIATHVPVVMGAAMILYSLCTDYEEGIIKRLSMTAHLRLDIIVGLFLAVSPWLFDFKSYVFLPHVAVGIFEIAVAMCTSTQPMGSSITARTSARRMAH